MTSPASRVDDELIDTWLPAAGNELYKQRRYQRDAALSDVNYWTEKWRNHWQPPLPPDRNRIWCGERP